ncbi:hypothetical protein HPT25_23320 [Bacillus sp. BRMEA1]|uniref:hypothetical protein n=1 Tax=Neobacillus endophyticus TaxID=2738405 RepID=UPI001566CC80|nr:hypothetical protein [Neobacillus endophyticus]NRD80256.1 hypothetical protein [Neobacillus endophyticus]
MQYLWWGLTIIFALATIVSLIGIFNPSIFNQNLKQGEKPWGRKQAIWTFSICLICTLIFISLAASIGKLIGEMLLNIGSFGFIVFIIWSIVSKIKKTGKTKNRLIYAGTFFVVGIIGSILSPDSQQTDSTAKNVNKQQTIKVSKATIGKVAQEQTKKNPEDTTGVKNAQENKKAEQEATANNKIKAEYIKSLKPTIDNFYKEYDSIWNTYWMPTFKSMKDGTYDQYKAYNNLVYVKQQYENMMTSLNITPVDGMSNEDKKEISDFEQNAQAAAMLRSEAAKMAADAVDKNDFPPSVANQITDKINESQSQMYTAIANIAVIENKYDIKR